MNNEPALQSRDPSLSAISLQPGAAALVAFLHIALSGYLGYVSWFFLANASPELLTDSSSLMALLGPAALAWFSWCPTDDLTRFLARVARVFALLAVLTLLGAIVLVAWHNPSPRGLMAVARWSVVVAVCALMGGGVLGRLAARAVCSRRPQEIARPGLPLSLPVAVLYLVGVCSIIFFVLLLSYAPLLFGPRTADGQFFAVEAVSHPLWFAVEIFALVSVVSGVPVVLPWLWGGVLRRPGREVHAGLSSRAVAGWIALCWVVLGSRWGAGPLGFELFVYVVLAALLAARLGIERSLR